MTSAADDPEWATPGRLGHPSLCDVAASFRDLPLGQAVRLDLALLIARGDRALAHLEEVLLDLRG